MNHLRIQAEAIRDQQWAFLSDHRDDALRIAEGYFDESDIPLIQRAFAIIRAEVLYREQCLLDEILEGER